MRKMTDMWGKASLKENPCWNRTLTRLMHTSFKNRNKYKKNAINEHVSLDKLLQRNYKESDLAFKKFKK